MNWFRAHSYSFLFIPFLFCVFTHIIPDFPVPPKTEKLLFYLQRTVNANTVLYEINLNPNGELNLEEPIKIHWIQFAKDSSLEDLNYIQKTFAYGLEMKLIDAVKKSFVFNFVSYKGRDLYLLRSAIDNKYHVYIKINNKLSILQKVYVHIEGGTFWVPEIRYVEVNGILPASAERNSEKVIP